jgi:hypothetical protein
MDQPAESIDTDDCAVASAQGDSGLRRLELKATVRPFCVVVAPVLSEDPLCMALSEDQQVVQALPPHGLHEALGEGVRLGRTDRRANDAHALVANTSSNGPRRRSQSWHTPVSGIAQMPAL